MIRVQVPATTANLGPGFDCLGMALELHNTIEITPAASALTIEVSGEGAAEIDRTENNLVYQAMQSVFKKAGDVPHGLKLRLYNQIPLARGLGSSTAAIVGGVIGANLLTGNKMTIKEVISLTSSLEGHPDNAVAAVLGGIVVAVKVDGEVKYMKINPPANLKGVVAVPDYGVPTRSSREQLPHQVSFHDASFNIGRVALLVAALQQGDLNMLGVAMDDRIHQPFRSVAIPGFKKVLAAARLAGARGVTLSGSGPSIIAFADSNLDLIARVMRDTFRQNGINARVLILKPSPIGARALETRS